VPGGAERERHDGADHDGAKAREGVREKRDHGAPSS
jgi:hypothetical protein